MCLALHASSGLLAVGQQGGEAGTPNLTLWQLADGSLQAQVEAVPDDYVDDVAFSDQGILYYYIRATGLNAYDPVRGEQDWKGRQVSDVRRLSCSGDGQRLLVSGRRTTLWQVDMEQIVWQLAGYEASGLTDQMPHVEGCWKQSLQGGYDKQPALAAFAADDRVIVTGHNRAQVEVFEVDTGQVMQRMACGPLQAAFLLVSPDEGLLGIVGRVPRGVWLWDLVSGERRLPATFDGSHTAAICLAHHRRRRLLLTGSSVGFLNTYELDTGRLVNSVQRHAGAIRRIVVHEEQDLLISGGDDGRVLIAKVV